MNIIILIVCLIFSLNNASSADVSANLSSIENPENKNEISEQIKPQVEETLSTKIPKFEDVNLKIKSITKIKEIEESSFEKFVGGGLKQFGYDFFYKSPSSFIPDQNVPVTPDYVIGPGDQIIVTIWGRINARWVVDVLRDGTIYLPKIGTINPTGVQFKDLRDFIKREISRYYTDFDINVSLGNIRSIRVYMVGNVRNPGAYTVSGLSTMISAIFESGGPSKNGSMRTIELKREGKTISRLDLYDLFLKGDKSSDIKLTNEDVIYVPPVGRLAAISSGVKNPGIYELKDDEKLLDLINMSGGFNNTAYNKKVSIRRIFNNQYRDYLEADISDIDKNPQKNISLVDGDIISINNVLDLDTSVSISGAVAYPGKIGIVKDSTTLSMAIKLAGGLLINASDEVEITRFNPTQNGVTTERFTVSLKKALNGDPNNDIILKPYDSILVKSIPNWYYPKYVSVQGEVQSPGVYVIEKGERLYSVLKRAGGFTSNAYPRGIIFTRESVRVQQQKNIEEIAQRLEKELFTQSVAEISTFLSQEELQSKKEILQQKQRFLEQIKKAKAIGRVYVKINSLDELKDSEYNIELQDGDTIIIPQKPDVVNVSGAVMAVGSYVYTQGDYKKYIDMAGGYSYYADKGRVFILKADGSAVKAKSFLFFSTKVEPGDTVVVPEKFETIAWLREIRDITQIITNLALSAGVVIKVF